MVQVSHVSSPGDGDVFAKPPQRLRGVTQFLYNETVIHFSPDRRLTRLLLLVLFGLLAMGPFLHAHLGFSKITGFHVAGYESPTSIDITPDAYLVVHLTHHAVLTDAESPAVGVSSSLLRPVPDVFFPDGLALQTVVAVIAVFLLSHGIARPQPARQFRSSRPRPGFPPPALAPPALIS